MRKCTKCGKTYPPKKMNKQVDGTYTCDPCIDAHRRRGGK